MIKNIRHKGLKRLYEDDDPRGVTAEHVTKLAIFWRGLTWPLPCRKWMYRVFGCICLKAT